MDKTMEAAPAKPGNEIVIPTKLTVLTVMLATVASGLIYWSAGAISLQAGIKELIVLTALALVMLPFEARKH